MHRIIARPWLATVVALVLGTIIILGWLAVSGRSVDPAELVVGAVVGILLALLAPWMLRR